MFDGLRADSEPNAGLTEHVMFDGIDKVLTRKLNPL